MLEGLSAPAPPQQPQPAAQGINLDALYGAPTQSAAFPPALQPQQHPQQPGAAYPGALMGGDLLGGLGQPSTAGAGGLNSLSGFGMPLGAQAQQAQQQQGTAGGVKPMAPRGNAAVEAAQPKKDPFADLFS